MDYLLRSSIGLVRPAAQGPSRLARGSRFPQIPKAADSFVDDLLARLAARRPAFASIPYGWAAERSAWPEHGFELLRTVQRAARRIGAPVLGPNLVGEVRHGPWKGRTYEGLSTAADATGLSLAQGRRNKEQLLMIELPPPAPMR